MWRMFSCNFRITKPISAAATINATTPMTALGVVLNDQYGRIKMYAPASALNTAIVNPGRTPRK